MQLVSATTISPSPEIRLSMGGWRLTFLSLLLALVTLIVIISTGFPTEKPISLLSTQAVTIRYHLDASRSRFFVHAYRGGLAWFKGHDHHIAAREFTGVAELTPTALNRASLQLTVRADSLEETDPFFTPQQKAIIKKELDEIVLETAKYPNIEFRSTDVIGDLQGGQFEIKIGGDLTLHGVTKHISIPATVSLEGDELRAKGAFKIDRSDFDVKATSAFHGFVRIRDGLKFTFEMIGKRS